MIEYLGLIALTTIFVRGFITEKFRLWLLTKNELLGRMINCAMCVGFWTGLIYSLFFFSIRNSILNAAIVSIGSCFIDQLLENLKVKNELLRGQKDISASGSDNIGK